MKNWKELLVSPYSSIFETMKNIDETAAQIALVVNEEHQLLGTVTDGDIRRGILKGISLEDQVLKVMNQNPVAVQQGVSRQAIKKLFQEKKLRQLPIVNENNQVVDVIFSNDIFAPIIFDNWVVLMAGGLGTRLRPLTENIPKPMLKVGTKPILQTILESFIEYGFHKFYLSVNYKREIIKEYFGDGVEWGVQIEYLDENKRLGTAGALSLFSEKPNNPIIVMNGDILTKINFQQLLQFHEETHSIATMCVREYQYQIPYGVVRIDGSTLCSIEEKPIERYFVNAGIYVLNPEALDVIPRNEYFDMPSLFETLIKQQKKTSVFPIREYWLDIGKMPDFEKANLEFSEVFG
ncbi:nucleotidyltransferase family protein [Anoxybacillus flavithermus]|uniref:Nucleotidyltransferase n=1 Tax=Anoxybacillus flavithermus AK1 TaxID=1297581 RepID=M8DYQ1_9BACL|nr:nucleotidyltransferase family protein [Anoxybacillus flavithermus]EMT45874.1 nucleotidyltransferase [Anoxybacillus flavithermus AK1]